MAASVGLFNLESCSHAVERSLSMCGSWGVVEDIDHALLCWRVVAFSSQSFSSSTGSSSGASFW